MDKETKAKIKQLEKAIEKSKSPYLKRDYAKCIEKLRRNKNGSNRKSKDDQNS